MIDTQAEFEKVMGDEEIREIRLKWVTSPYAKDFIAFDIYRPMKYEEYKALLVKKWKELDID